MHPYLKTVERNLFLNSGRHNVVWTTIMLANQFKLLITYILSVIVLNLSKKILNSSCPHLYFHPLCYREQVNKLRSEMSKLSVLLKEENLADSKESAESSGENDSHTNIHQTMQTLRSEARSHRKVVRLLKEQLQRNTKAKADGGPRIDAELIDSMARKMERMREEHEATRRHAANLEDRLKDIQSRERNEGREQEEKERKKKGRQDQGKKLKHAVSLKPLCMAYVFF